MSTGDAPARPGIPVARGLTYDDLAAMPEPGVDGLRKELIDGELYVSPSPVVGHQRASGAIFVALHRYAQVHGGLALQAPMDVVFAPSTVVQPDVLYLAASSAAAVPDDDVVHVAPDLVVEVSSPSTRRLDLIKKRRLFERQGVPEYWFVDLEAEVVDVHRLDTTGHYGDVETVGGDDTLSCLAAPGFELSVTEALG